MEKVPPRLTTANGIFASCPLAPWGIWYFEKLSDTCMYFAERIFGSESGHLLFLSLLTVNAATAERTTWKNTTILLVIQKKGKEAPRGAMKTGTQKRAAPGARQRAAGHAASPRGELGKTRAQLETGFHAQGIPAAERDTLGSGKGAHGAPPSRSAPRQPERA